jgi:hypothetical protein
MSDKKGDNQMDVRSLVEKVRIGASEMQVVISGAGLLPTADGAACCCCCSSCSSGVRAK